MSRIVYKSSKGVRLDSLRSPILYVSKSLLRRDIFKDLKVGDEISDVLYDGGKIVSFSFVGVPSIVDGVITPLCKQVDISSSPSTLKVLDSYKKKVKEAINKLSNDRKNTIEAKELLEELGL